MEKKLNVVGLISMIAAAVGLFIFPLYLGIAGLVTGIVGITMWKTRKLNWFAVVGTALSVFNIVYAIIVMIVLKY